jgi:GDP-4-dehydro-6-deoxy-D-mannose reductase
MRVLITGAGGFVGPYLRQALARAGHEAHGLGQVVRDGDLRVDITDAQATRQAVAAVRPDAVVHLAGLSSVAECAKDPQRALQVNAGGTLNVAQAVLSLGSPCRLLVVSSGEVYGAAAGHAPVDESVEPDPMNVYGATKRAAEIVALQLRHQGLDVVVARPFNHIGAGQTPTFVLPSFAQQLAAVPRGAPVTLEVGNLTAVRDFSHVLDVVDAYVVLLERGQRGQIYNVASGLGRSIESMLHALVTLSGRAASVHVDPKRLRPVDLPYLAGDTTRLSRLGWAPSRTVEQALEELLASVEG